MMNIDLDGIADSETSESTQTESKATVSEPAKQISTEAKTEPKAESTKKLDALEKAFEDVPDDLGDDAEIDAKLDKIEAKEPEKAEGTDDKPLKILAPAQFTEAQKKEFEKLPVQMQASISKMAYDMRSELSRQSQITQPLKPVLDTYNKYAPEYQKVGIGLDKVVINAIEWDRAISNPEPQAKKAALRAFLQANDCDPLDLLDDSDNYQPQTYQSKQESSITPEMLDKMIEERISLKEQTAKQIEFATKANSDIQRFVESNELFKDPQTGNQLELAMQPYVAMLHEQNKNNPSISPLQILKQAYNIVVSDDSLPFKSLLAVKQADTDRREAEKAASASKSITGGMKGHTRSPASLKGDEIWSHHFAGFKF